MKKYCFVIQPFNEKFNKRYEDIIKPAIEECGLLPYRVDEDNSVVIPIDSIEDMISKSSICVAEVSTNNPNVWFEVGYAMALGVPVVLICSDERTEQYPFDVRHRNILQYRTLSLGDYEKFRNNLVDRISSYLLSLKCNKEEEIEDLTMEERNILFFIAKHQVLPNQALSANDIESSSIDKEKVIFILRKLVNTGFIQYIYALDNGVTNHYCQLTNKAEDWITKNI